jgi:hypothetical protein
MIFNWKVFTVTLTINLGPGSLQIPPFVVFFLLGFVIIGILSWSNYVSNLQRIIYELEQGVELGKMRNKMVRNKLHEELMDTKNIDSLKQKLGIEEIQQKQLSLVKMLMELKETMERKGQDS